MELRAFVVAVVLVASSCATPVVIATPQLGNASIDAGLMHRLTPSIDPAATARIKVLLDPTGTTGLHEQVSELNSLGHIGTWIGDLVTLDIPLRNVPKLEMLEFVRKIEAPRPMRPLLDVSVPEIGAPDVWATVKDESGRKVDGTGTLIGVVDTGIDWNHPDFFFGNGTSKIAFIWDQSGTGSPPSKFSYGTECVRADIEAKVCPEVDEEGHGTFVAGIATSTGLASKKYYGVAPGAALIFVKAKPYYDHKHRWYTEDNAIIDGVNYLWQKAQSLGEPIVVNISLGQTTGPQDNTSLLETALNEFAAQGAVIVVAAGDHREEKLHTTGALAAGSSVFVNWVAHDEEKKIDVDIWYSPADKFAISVRTPSGEVVDGPTSEEGVVTHNGNVKILSSSTEIGKEWLIETATDAFLEAGPWGFTLKGVEAYQGRWDAWMSTEGNFMGAFGYAINETCTIGSPGTATGVITVGAYATKLKWQTLEGETYGFTSYWQGRQRLNTIATFSGFGPTRDGRTKPDVVAPGFGVSSARSSKVKPDPSDEDKWHSILAGTSAAAAHVSGLVALIMQFNPYLTANQVKELLRAGARTDRFTGKIDPQKGSNTWGWGKTSAKSSVLKSASLFSVTILFEGLPARVSVDVRVDGTFVSGVRGNETKTLELNAGSHVLEVSEIVPLTNEVRYRVSENSWSFSKGGRKVLHYLAQYYLRVDSERGDPTGSGWYDAGANAPFSVNRLVPGASGVDYFLIPWKTTFVFDHWTNDSLSDNPSDSLGMDGPKMVTATWKIEKSEDYTFLLVLMSIASICGMLVVVVFARRRRPAHVAPTAEPVHVLLERLEEMRRKGQVSDRVYEKIRREYLERARSTAESA